MIASASVQVPSARWFAPLRSCVCGENLIKRDWKAPYKWQVILLVFLSSASSVITSNFLAKTPLTFTYPLLAWFSTLVRAGRKSTTEFHKTAQHGASSQGSLMSGGEPGKAKAWSGRTLQVGPFQPLALGQWHGFPPGDILVIVTFP